VYDICWLQSKTGSECASCSTDGSTYWWDIRRMGEPVDTLTLQEKNSNVVLGAVCMEYEPAAGPTKLMVGTEQGTVLLCNRKAKNPADRVAVRTPPSPVEPIAPLANEIRAIVSIEGSPRGAPIEC